MSAADRVPLPADTGAGLEAQLHRWAASAPMRELVAAFGGALPDAGAAATLAWLDDFSARHWDFRTARRVERHQVVAPELTPAQLAATLRAADALGFTAAGAPPLRDYDHVLVLGGMARTCLHRAAHAARLVTAEGVRAGRVTALGSFRPLDETEALALPGPARYEVDALEVAMRAAFGARDPMVRHGSPGPVTHESWSIRSGSADGHPTPGSPSGLPLRVLAAPSGEPGVRRANTADTYRFWAADAGVRASDRVLVVTSPAYVPFQHCDALRMLTVPHGCLVHTVGSGPPAAPDRYLQEIRSAVRSMRRLVGSASMIEDGERTPR